MTPLTGCHGGATALSSPSLCVSSDSLRLNQSYIKSFIKLSTQSPSRLSYDPSYNEAVHAAYKMLCHRYTDAISQYRGHLSGPSEMAAVADRNSTGFTDGVRVDILLQLL